MLRFDNLWQYVGFESRELSVSIGLKISSLAIKIAQKRKIENKIGLAVSGQAIKNTDPPIIIG